MSGISLMLRSLGIDPDMISKTADDLQTGVMSIDKRLARIEAMLEFIVAERENQLRLSDQRRGDMNETLSITLKQKDLS